MHKFINSVLMESPCDSPFAPKEKKIWPAVIAGVAALAGAAISSAVNKSTSDKNVEAQERINEQNIDAAQKQMEYQNQWNLDQWNRQNEYNAPANQVKLLKEAGLNPAYMYGANGSAVASQLMSAQKSDRGYAVAPHYDNWLDLNMNDVGSAVNAFYDAQLKNSESRRVKSVTAGQDIFNEQSVKQFRWVYEKLKNDAKKSGFEGDMARRQIAYFDKTMETNYKMLLGDAQIQEKNAKILDSQLDSILLDNELKKIVNAYEPLLKEGQIKQVQSTINQIHASIGLISANTTLSRAQAEHEIEKKVSTIIDNGMKGLDYKIKDETKSIAVQMAKENLYKMEDERFFRPLDFYGRHNAADKILLPGASSASADVIERNYKRDKFGKRLYGSNYRPHL